MALTKALCLFTRLEGFFMSDPFIFQSNDSPLLISIPHVGREVPPELFEKTTPAGRELADTDWHLDQLYDFARSLNASVLMARYSRYVVDLNRPPNDETLYPGQTKTGLFPQLTFRGEPVFSHDGEPDEAERERRLSTYWHPYHRKIGEEIARIKARHGKVLVWEAHSIASQLPRLFPGKLSDLNVGTNGGLSAAPELLEAVKSSLKDCPYTWVLNDRFKGGYITRHFGAPANGVHTIQLEMCHSTYMNEDHPFEYRPDLANQVKPVVAGMVSAALDALKKL
jgi:N-formylglutamate deformylase